MPKKANSTYRVKRTKKSEDISPSRRFTPEGKLFSLAGASSVEEAKALEREYRERLDRILENARKREIESLSPAELDTGREMTAAIVERYRDVPLSELIKNSQRPKSMLIYKMMASSGVSFSELAYYLMCYPQSLRNKLSRDTFSLDDLIAAANICGYDLILRKKDGSEEMVIDADTFFKYSENEKTLDQWARLVLREEEEFNRKKREMVQLQERMKQLQNELGSLLKKNEEIRNDIEKKKNNQS